MIHILSNMKHTLLYHLITQQHDSFQTPLFQNFIDSFLLFLSLYRFTVSKNRMKIQPFTQLSRVYSFMFPYFYSYGEIGLSARS